MEQLMGLLKGLVSRGGCSSKEEEEQLKGLIDTISPPAKPPPTPPPTERYHLQSEVVEKALLVAQNKSKLYEQALGKEQRLSRELDEFRLRILVLAKDKDDAQAEFDKQTELLKLDSDSYFQDCREQVSEDKPAEVQFGRAQSSGLSADERARGQAEAAQVAAAAAAPASVAQAQAAQASVATIPVEKVTLPLDAHQQKILDERVASAILAVATKDDSPQPKRAKVALKDDDEMGDCSDEEAVQARAAAAAAAIGNANISHPELPSSG
jgi:hypothetical protein